MIIMGSLSKSAWYHAALAAKNEGRDLPPVSENAPEVGFFFRKASKQGGRIPVVIYDDANGERVARSGTRSEHRIEDAGAVWTWVAKTPIERDSYVWAWEKDKWPDGSPTRGVENGAAGHGSNLPADPFERLQLEIEDKLASAKALIEDAAAKQDRTRADRARNLQAELLALNKSADGMFEAEKAPHLAAGRTVDEKFRFRDRVKEVCARLRVVAENILKAEEARLREEARIKHEAALREAQAERERIEADRAKLMIDDPIKAMTDPEPDLPPIPAEPEPVRVRAGGGVGRAMGLQSVWIGDIVDYEATIHHYRKHPEVRELIEKLVKRAVKADKSEANIPGVKVREDRRAA